MKSYRYKEFGIEPKLDFGGQPYLSNGKYFMKGWVVTKKNVNVMPGGVWFGTLSEAKRGILELKRYGSRNFWRKHRKQKLGRRK